MLWMGSIHWLLCNVLHLLHMVCSSMALHSTSIWRVLLQFRKLSHLELATPCSCHRSSEGHLQRLTAPRGTPTASVAALELASRTPATLLARARTPRMVERQRCRMPSGWPGFVYPQYRPHPRQRRPKGRATDCSRPATPVREGRSPLSRSCNPNSLITKAGVRGHRKTRPRTLRGGEARVGYPAS